VKLAESRRARESVAAQYCEAEPAHILEGALARTTDRYHAAIFDPKEVGAPNRAIRSYKGDPPARAGLLLCAYTFLRPGEVHSLEWTDFDVEGAVITIPAVWMKVPRPHKVPLPGQVLGILEGMPPISGGRRHLLPSLRSEDQPMSDNTMNAALRWLGYPQGR
jgi:integrase